MLALVLLLVAALALGKYLNIKKLIAAAPKPTAQTVSTIKAESQAWQAQIEATGSLVPVRGLTITPEVSGRVDKIHFKSGQNVKQGDVLITLSDSTERAQLQSLLANADSAANTLKRDKLQYQAGIVSKAQVDNDLAAFKVAQANVAQQMASIGKKTIRAPFAGRLGITTINPGQFVNVGDSIVTLQTVHPMYVTFSLPEKYLSQVRTGQTVQLSTSGSGNTYSGKITSKSPLVDSATRNVLYQATIDNKEGDLMAGMFAEISVDTGVSESNITLPQSAITYNTYGSTVYVVVNDEKKGLIAKQVFVTTGATRGDQVAVTKGLNAGDEVVTSGQIKLKNDTSVVVNNSVQPPNSPNPMPQEK